MRPKGLFITLEGTDGSGKSTQIAYIEEFLQKEGIPYICTREPGGTRIGEKIRSLILDPELTEMDPMTETMLYAAARAQNLAEVIRPALEKGQLVLADRFLDSSEAYQGAARGLGDSVCAINREAVMETIPDRTYLIDVDPAVGRSRITDSFDRLERERLDFHRKVRGGYRRIAEREPDRVLLVDGSLPKEEVRDIILRDLRKLLGR